MIKLEILDYSPTGYFGEKTKEALIEFQKAEGIIQNENSAGAGKVGQKTVELLNDILAREKQERDKEQIHVLAYQKAFKRLQYFAQKQDRNYENYAFLTEGVYNSEVGK